MSLFVGNISHSAAPRDVEDLFKKFGECRVDVKRGFAFIDFEDDRDAEDALRELQGSDLHGMRINVEWSKRHLARKGGFHDRGYDRGYDRGGRYGGRGGYDRDRGYERRDDRGYDRRDRRRDDRDHDRNYDRNYDRNGDRGHGRDRDDRLGRDRDDRLGRDRDDNRPGAGWKRRIDDGPAADRVPEQGDAARRRVEDGYEKENKGRDEDANGNGTSLRDDDRENKRDPDHRADDRRLEREDDRRGDREERDDRRDHRREDRYDDKRDDDIARERNSDSVNKDGPLRDDLNGDTPPVGAIDA